MVPANDSFPGITLEAVVEDQVSTNVGIFAYGEGLAFHWHGQELRGTSWADGAYGVSQAHIYPGKEFTYNFAAGPVGMHIDEQVGLVGAWGLKRLFMVRPTTDTRETLYDEEMVMQISDPWHEPEVCLVHDGGFLQNPMRPPIDRCSSMA